ncbi:MAG TPA: hypothetical protein VJ790_06760 [Dongiaceae bacterium]|nr:hypothetical protein [Dongiaceae bacterium]
MKVTTFGVAVAALLLMSACATGERATGEPAPSPSVVRIAVADMPYPPFSFKNAFGTWAGFDVDLSRAVCEVE